MRPASPGVKSSPSGQSRRKPKSACGSCSTTIALLGTLLLIVVLQGILFPLVISTIVSSVGTSDIDFKSFIPSQLTEYAAATTAAATDHTRQRRRRRRTTTNDRPPDGTFNGGPVYLQTKPASELASSVHCVGETYQKQTAWKSRSCRFEFMCFNTSSHDYVVFESASDRALAKHFAKREYMHVSDSLHRLNESNSVAIGGINLKWGKKGIPRLKWFPKVNALRRNDARVVSYYELPASTILIPFHSLNGANPGHLVWDDYLPIYNLLSMFQLKDGYDLLPMRYVLQDGAERGLWASCDLRPVKTAACKHMMQKFLPLIAGLDSLYKFTTTIEAELQENKPGQSTLVCSKIGLAGVGPLTDHGLNKAHGWEEIDYKSVQNFGRGGLVYEFRNFMLENMNIPTEPPKGGPHSIVFSINSSDIFNRKMDFEKQVAGVAQAFPDARVESFTLKEMSLQEQLEVAASASVFVTLCGGGAVTAMFLPKGSSAIIYYAEDGGIYNGKMNYKPAMLDWDLFNAMSHLRVHWMPRNTMKTEHDQEALVMLIRHELELIDTLAFA